MYTLSLAATYVADWFYHNVHHDDIDDSSKTTFDFGIRTNEFSNIQICLSFPL